jgi:hypothetical protein
MYIRIKRTCEGPGPFHLAAEAGNDWTHFAHVHRRSHMVFKLLHKSGNREIFYYKARTLYPFPFYTPYIAFREYAPEQNGYKQIYYDLRSGRVHYVSASHAMKGSNVQTIGEHWFDLPEYWRFFPKLFMLLFKIRMKRVMQEDSEMLREEVEAGIEGSDACLQSSLAEFSLFDEMTGAGFPKAAFAYEDYRVDPALGREAEYGRRELGQSSIRPQVQDAAPPSG